ncbi:hypothetical protein [Burkholderia sp. D-99]|uniref:hypothetical protein n=1 Tax=Burkholderia sp. D-99 TaxID=2717316 RepID=UPI0014203A5F|nr:hypothetical protein [Burkholderia sp. D-99]NHV26922.1 hypothetical protein [Burkholderia sp. D-99]
MSNEPDNPGRYRNARASRFKGIHAIVRFFLNRVEDPMAEMSLVTAIRLARRMRSLIERVDCSNTKMAVSAAANTLRS